jgi:predicted enzyme related to lactoylglutathione lyase
MADPIVHFEIIGRDPGQLRGYYGELFGWEYSVGDTATEKVSESLGGRRVFGPEGTPGEFMVGRFTDPEGNLIGVAGTA